MTKPQSASSVLFEFGVLVDTDYAVLNKYANNEFEVNQLTTVLRDRPSENPLSAVFKDSIPDIEFDYKDLLSVAIRTDIFTLALEYIHNVDIKCFIWCRRKEEVKYMKILLKSIPENNYIIVTDDIFDIKQYDAIFVKYVSSLIPTYGNIDGKTIYISTLAVNLDLDKLEKTNRLAVPKEYYVLYGSHNEIRLFDLYSDYLTKKKGGDE